MWYQAVIEKVILYGSGVWAGKLTKQQNMKLKSMVRPFLLRATAGFRTTSTDALFLLMGLVPIDILVKNNYYKFNFKHYKKNYFTNADGLDPELYDGIIKMCLIHPSERVKYIDNDDVKTDISIYTDGSRMENRTGYAFCVFQNDDLIETHKFKLQEYNTVFQAELSAIHGAVMWLSRNNLKGTVYSDSLSSILALQSANNRSKFLSQIKSDLYKRSGLFSLSWVKAHAEIHGNEEADKMAKEALESGIPAFAPQPNSLLTKTLTNNIIRDWQNYWNSNQAGSRIQKIFPIVNTNRRILHRSLVFYVTGHGPFPSYLYRFKLRDNPDCSCGGLGDPDHYIFDCPLTGENHLSRPVGDNWVKWIEEICSNNSFKEKIRKALSKAQDVCNG